MHRALLLVLAAGSAAAASVPLAGTWAGDRLSLTANAGGILVQGDCASGKIEGAVVPDGTGRFTMRGYYNESHSGMTLADLRAIDRPAIFTGVVTGNRVDLTIDLKGQPARHFTLKRDRQIKFARCL